MFKRLAVLALVATSCFSCFATPVVLNPFSVSGGGNYVDLPFPDSSYTFGIYGGNGTDTISSGACYSLQVLTTFVAGSDTRCNGPFQLNGVSFTQFSFGAGNGTGSLFLYQGGELAYTADLVGGWVIKTSSICSSNGPEYGCHGAFVLASPEPSTWLLGWAGLLGLLGWRRRAAPFRGPRECKSCTQER